MTSEEEVVAAAKRFYEGIEHLVSGRGLGLVEECWDHSERVTGGHPSGEWSQGWDEVRATWEVFAGFGRHDRGGSQIRSLKAHVYGDVAYTTCLFTASQGFGGETLACTNVFVKKSGAWKVVHHHADKSPAMGAALEKIAQGG
jgi:hypothetical protein